ncbi:3966_t:CDS:2, partial [Cetraspora pellucida]
MFVQYLILPNGSENSIILWAFCAQLFFLDGSEDNAQFDVLYNTLFFQVERDRLFKSISKKRQTKYLHAKVQWKKDFKRNIEEMQKAMKQASWMSKDEQHKVEQVVDAFVKTKLERLHFTSPSVIG